MKCISTFFKFYFERTELPCSATAQCIRSEDDWHSNQCMCAFVECAGCAHTPLASSIPRSSRINHK